MKPPLPFLLFLSITAAADQPHIVFVLADDMGYGDLKAYNPESKIPTPHLDRMAAEGMTFTDAHSGGSTCKPSRYALLTGRFAARRDRFSDNRGPILAEDRATLPGMLRDSGYRTAMVGKWHLGFDQKGRKPGETAKGFAFAYDQPISGGPVDRGFDSFFGMHASLDIQPYFYIRDRNPTRAPVDRVEANNSDPEATGWNHIQGAFWRAGDVAPDFKHVEVTPRFAEEACAVIRDHDGEKPLFLYLALPSPHTPWLPTEEFIGSSKAGMYGDFMVQVDSVVGQIMINLEKAGMTENTLLLFSSDNGPVWYDKDIEKFGHRSVGPLRGCKGSVWEGGHRVPFLVKWPGKIGSGTTNDSTIAFADVFATLAEVAGREKIGEGDAEDSESFLQAMLQPDLKWQRESPLLHGDQVIRDGDWKLIATKGGRGFNADRKVKYGIELYHLGEDISEENNLAEARPEKVESLKEKIREILGKQGK